MQIIDNINEVKKLNKGDIIYHFRGGIFRRSTVEGHTPKKLYFKEIEAGDELLSYDIEELTRYYDAALYRDFNKVTAGFIAIKYHEKQIEIIRQDIEKAKLAAKAAETEEH